MADPVTDDAERGWVDLSDDESDAVWRRFSREFAFRPSTDPRQWPGIRLPAASVSWDLAASWARPRQWPPAVALRAFDVDTQALELLVMAALRDCAAPDTGVYALDWQHADYRCAPRDVDDARVDEWPVSIVPNGDYHVFLDPDLRFGVFGHPWQATLSVFGEPLLHWIAQRDESTLPPVFRG